MYAQINKSQENKSRTVANSVSRKKSIGMPNVGFVNNRPESIIEGMGNNEVLQGKFTARIDVQPNVGDNLYTANNLSINEASLSEKDRPLTGLDNQSQGKHIFAWTERINILSQIAKKGLTVMDWLGTLVEFTNQDKEEGLLNVNLEAQFLAKQNLPSVNWMTQISKLTELYLDTLQKTKIARVGGKSTFGGENFGRDTLNQLEEDATNNMVIDNAVLEKALSQLIDTKGQVNQQLGVEYKLKAYNDIIYQLKLGHPTLFKAKMQEIINYLDSAFKMF